MKLKESLKKIITMLKHSESDKDFIVENGIKLTDEDGENMIFKGEVKGNEPNGFGEAQFEGGDLYLGYFKNKKRDGVGMYKWKEGDYYVGNWSNNARNGFGINYVKKANTVIFGEFEDNRIIDERGAISKSLDHKYCIICGKNKKLVEVLIAGGVKNRTICNNCIIESVKLLKKEMNYNETEILKLIDEK